MGSLSEQKTTREHKGKFKFLSKMQANQLLPLTQQQEGGRYRETIVPVRGLLPELWVT